MAKGYSAGDLYLNIDSVAYDTIKNLDAVIERLNIINSNLGTMQKGSKLSSLNAGTTAPSKKTSSFFKNFLRLGRWTAIYHIGRRLGSTMADIVTAGSDFGETLNLWKVAMGNEFLPQATEFVNKLNEAYGISKETLMNSQAIFKNMLGSLGQISDATAYQLSEGITQMALDYASLYNVKFEDAMTKFQAALAGQVRPIRSVSGYDITENTLFQLYQSLGGTKTMRQLSRTEKQLLAIYAVFEQMGRSGATGDLERTINSFANQSRVMADSWKDVKTYAGLTVTRLLEQWEVMKYINAVLIFMSRILEGLATSLDTGLGESGDVFGEMEGGINDTTEAVENLQNALLDFDKFRALDTQSTSSDLGIDKNLLDAMTKYNSILGEADLEARKLADQWIEDLGGLEVIVSNIIDKLDKLKDIKVDIEKILAIIGGVIFVNALSNVLTTISKITLALDVLKKHPIIAIIGIVVTLLTTLYTTNEDFRESINKLFDTLSPSIGTLTSLVADIIEPLTKHLGTILDDLAPIITLLTDLTSGILPYLEVTLTPLVAVLEFIAKILHSLNLLIEAATNENWSGFSKSFSDIWGNWDVTKTFWEQSTEIYTSGLPDKTVVNTQPNNTTASSTTKQEINPALLSITQAVFSGTMNALNIWWGGSEAKSDIPQLQEANSTNLYQVVTGVANSFGNTWSNIK